jgi:hypothetical protein
MKRLYTFDLDEEVESRVQETSKNENGEDVTTTKVVKETKLRTLFIRKPYRKLYDDAELFYGVMISQGIQAGLITRPLLAKRYENDGGVLNEKEKGEYAKLYMQLFEYQNEFSRIQLAKDEAKTPEEKENLESEQEKNIIELVRIREKLQDYEAAQQTIFEQTAENRARDKTILWWTLMLSYIEDEDGSERPFFGAGEFDERLEEYDRMETLEDPFLSEVTRKFAYYVSFWYMGKVTDESEFKELEAFDTRTEEEKEKEANLIKEVIERDAKIALDAQDEISDLVLKTREEQEKLEEEDAKIEAEVKKIDEEGERIRAEAMEGQEESPPEGNQESTEANDSESKEAG